MGVVGGGVADTAGFDGADGVDKVDELLGGVVGVEGF